MHSLKSDSQTVERKGIEGTPFQLIKYEEKFHISWNEYALTNRYESEEEALELLKTDIWNIVGVYVVSIIDMRQKIEAVYGTTDLSKIVEIHGRRAEETS